jgi:hypothetical protein
MAARLSTSGAAESSVTSISRSLARKLLKRTAAASASVEVDPVFVQMAIS